MSASPNVIFITIDALRTDRTSLHGYHRQTTPTLDRLSKNAIVCNNAFSHCAFTQPAVTEIFTSSRPFSHGGYDQCAIGRPVNLFKFFRDAGYHTTNLTTVTWVGRYTGYQDGIDEEIILYGLYAFPGNAMAKTRNILQSFSNGDLDEASMLALVEPEIEKCFRDTLDYCELQTSQWGEIRRAFPESPLVKSGFDFKRVIRLIAKHKKEFEKDRSAYIHRYLLPAATPSDWHTRWLLREWRFMRSLRKLISEFWFRTLITTVKPFNPHKARQLKYETKNYPDAHSIAEKIVDLLKNHDGGKPLFIWSHFQDCHTPYVSGGGKNWKAQTKAYLKKLGYSPDIDPTLPFEGKPKSDVEAGFQSALYDSAIRSTDDALGKIIDALEESGQADNTIIAIAGDHGEELGDHGDWGHFFRLHDHNTHVPMMFYRPGLNARRIESFTTVMDIAPTLTHMAGLPPSNDWEGQSLFQDELNQPDQLVFETFFGGNCLFEHRPPYMAVRSHQYLYLWCEYVDPGDHFKPEIHQLYDIINDPEQTKNIYSPDHPALPELQFAIAERLAEIPEVSTERITAAFGENGRHAAQNIRKTG